jgi:hypothetical protein
MDVRVDERRRQEEPVGVDHTVSVRVEPGAELGDCAAVDADIEDGVDPIDRVEYAGAADDQVLARRLFREEHYATSWSSATLTPTGPVVSRS